MMRPRLLGTKAVRLWEMPGLQYAYLILSAPFRVRTSPFGLYKTIGMVARSIAIDG